MLLYISHKYNIIVCVSMTSPCSLNRGTTLARVPPGYVHGVMAAA